MPRGIYKRKKASKAPKPLTQRDELDTRITIAREQLVSWMQGKLAMDLVEVGITIIRLDNLLQQKGL